jgi:4a-hydroxytetrahydrobiopterin dehydratase
MNERVAGLANETCHRGAGGVQRLSSSEVATLLQGLSGWEVADGRLRKDFQFPDHFVTMAFVNGAAWISHRQDHHPDLTVGYNTCRVEYVTHAVHGLSRNDFICAAKIDALLDL